MISNQSSFTTFWYFLMVKTNLVCLLLFINYQGHETQCGVSQLEYNSESVNFFSIISISAVFFKQIEVGCIEQLHPITFFSLKKPYIIIAKSMINHILHVLYIDDHVGLLVFSPTIYYRNFRQRFIGAPLVWDFPLLSVFKKKKKKTIHC